MKNHIGIRSKLKELNVEMISTVMRRDQYQKEGNEFAFDLMLGKLGEILAQIKMLKWVLEEKEQGL
ncbi:MAG: hypothetical protein ACN6N1_08380 [Acinetobacter guillouiae]